MEQYCFYRSTKFELNKVFLFDFVEKYHFNPKEGGEEIEAASLDKTLPKLMAQCLRMTMRFKMRTNMRPTACRKNLVSWPLQELTCGPRQIKLWRQKRYSACFKGAVIGKSSSSTSTHNI